MTEEINLIASTPITMDCFEMDDFESVDYIRDSAGFDVKLTTQNTWNGLIKDSEALRQKYNETKDKRYLKELIRLLPNSYKVIKNMTDEEKSIMEEWTVTQEEAEAEKYANEKHCKKCIDFAECVESAIEDRCKTYCESYKDYLNGLTKERKEAASHLLENWCRNEDDYCPHLKQLEKDNEELKAKLKNLKKTYRKQRNKRIDELQKENAELKKDKEYLDNTKMLIVKKSIMVMIKVVKIGR